MEISNLKKDRNVRRKNPDISTLVYGKIPPQAKDLEEAVLGAIMLEKGAFDTVVEILRPECFYVEAHQKIFHSMKSLSDKSMPIDLLTVVEELKTMGDLELVGGPYFITKLTNMVASTANLEAHSRIVLQKFIQRELIRIFEDHESGKRHHQLARQGDAAAFERHRQNDATIPQGEIPVLDQCEKCLFDTQASPLPALVCAWFSCPISETQAA